MLQHIMKSTAQQVRMLARDFPNAAAVRGAIYFCRVLRREFNISPGPVLRRFNK